MFEAVLWGKLIFMVTFNVKFEKGARVLVRRRYLTAG
jgi:hypothetical protein